jgi:hypothetical protein
MTATVQPNAKSLAPHSLSPDFKEIARLAREAAGVTIVQVAVPENAGAGLPASVPLAIVHGERPAATSLQDVLETYRIHPRRKQGVAKALTLESFISLANHHKTALSAVFADTTWTEPTFTAVIDYQDNTSAASYMRHRISYTFPLSQEWQVWTDSNGAKNAMSQGAFAAFLEDRIAELSAPTAGEAATYERDFATTIASPAQLIALSRGLQVNVESKVKTFVTLQTGEMQLQFEETHTDGDGRPLKVPGLFILSIAPFFMGEKVRIPVRLRYRKAGEKIVWFYDIYRPDQHITERVRDDLDKVGKATGLPCFEGTAEAQ